MKVKKHLGAFARQSALIIGIFVILLIVLIILFFTRDWVMPRGSNGIRSFLGIESVSMKERRLQNYTSTLPALHDGTRLYAGGIDGECKELTDSSSLPSVRDVRLISKADFEIFQKRVLEQTKADGVTWYGNDSTSRPFQYEGKTYKMRFVEYKPDGRRGLWVTACD